MMSRYFVCCENCFETIGKQSTVAAKLWMDLCALRLKSGEYIEISSQDFPELRTLELLGFVVSTDKPQSIKLRINGHQTTADGEDFFCVKEGQHEG